MSVEPESSERQGADIRLVALYRNARQPVRELTRSLTLMGRGRDCDIVLASDSVGTAHAAIVRLGNAAYVCDLGAPTGTVVNGRAIRWARLSDGNDLILGRFRFRIELGESTLEPTGECPVFSLTSATSGTTATGRAPVLIVGSAEGCDIRLASQDVSPRHCMVVWTQHGPVVRDLGSETGTRHNSRAVTLGRLLAGDAIDVGPHTLTFKIKTQIDKKETSDASSGDRLVPPSAPRNSAAIISGRLDRERVPALDELWPSPERLDAAVSLHTETARDLRLLEKASDRIAATDAAIEDADDEASALAALSRGSLGREQQARQETDSSVLATRDEKRQAFGGSVEGVTTVVAQAVRSGRARVSRGRSGGTALADKSDAARIRERILKQAAELQRRRDLDRGRTLMPPTGRGPVAPPPSLGPADEPTRGIPTHPRGLDVATPPARPAEASMPAADASAKALADLREQAARERAKIDRLTREVTEREEMWQRRAAKLEMELAQARDEVKVTTQKLARHLELHGTVEARTRKLDQRVAELRERVAGAQEALDERARKIRAGLEQERERLRSRRTEIREQALKLEESLRSRREEIEKTLAVRTAAIEAEREEIRAAGETLKRREEHLEAQQAALEQSEQERNDAFRTKEAEREAELEALRQDWQKRQRAVEEAGQAAMDRQEAALAKRLAELEDQGHAELERKTAELEQRLNARHAELDLETAAAESEYQAKLTALSQREADLDRVRDELDVRDTSVVEREVELTDREQALLKQAEQIDERQDELAGRIAEAERREERLRQSEESVNAERGRIEADRESVEAERNKIAQRRDDLDQRAEELETRFAELTGRRDGLEQERETIESQRAELDGREAALASREGAIGHRQHELDIEATRLAEAREEFRSLEERDQELDRRDMELAAREDALNERVSAYEHEVDGLEQSRDDIDEFRARQTAERGELEGRAALLDERLARAEDMERRAREAKAAQEAEREELDDLRGSNEARAAQLEVRHQDLSRRVAELEEAEVALQLDRERLAEQEQTIAREKTELQRAEERLASDRTGLDLARERLADESGIIERTREEIASKGAAIEVDRARLERDRLAVRDRERELSEQRTRLKAATREADQAKDELEHRISENEDLRRELTERADRARACEERLARETSALDERGRLLDRELEDVRHTRRGLDHDRASLEEERLALETERRRFGEELGELDQSRRTFQAGMRELEHREANHAERETELAERVKQLEAYRERLEEEYAELDRQRQDLAKAQVSDGASSEKLSILMEQAEASRSELRAREEEDFAHQQALAARAAELAKAEEELRQRTESLDERTREIETSWEVLASERDEFESIMASEREHVESLRHEAEEKLAAERETLDRRSSELEADYAARLRELESQGATRDKQYISELRRKIEEDYAKRSAELRGKEDEVERQCKQRLDEVEKDIQQRLAGLEDQIRQRREQTERELAGREATLDSDMKGARERLDAEVQDLQCRQASLAEEQARLRETRAQLESERDAFQSERLALVTEDEPADGPTSGEEARIDSAALAGRAADLDARQTRLDARARVIREAYDELKQFRLRVSTGDAGAFDGREVGTESLDRLRDMESESIGLDAEDLDGPIVLPDDFAQGEPVPAAVGVWSTAPADDGPEQLARGSARRFPLARTLLLAVMFGIAVGVVYLMWSARQDVEVAGELALQDAESAAAMSAGAHLDRLLAILPAASAGLDADLAELHRQGKISVRQSESALELVAVVSPSERAAAREWIDAIGKTYVASLGREPDSEADVQERLAELQTARAGAVRNLDGIRHEIEVMQAELASDPRLGDTEKTRKEKARTKTALERAMADRAAARAALATLQQNPPTAGPITPTEAQRKAAYQTDPDLIQDMDQRAARAVEFHDTLTGAMSSTQGPLAGHQTTIEAFISHVDEQLKSQADPDISKELEQIAVHLQDYRDESRRFASGWDDLAPKVAGWPRSGDPEALLEYQRQAEDLVRKFDKATKASLGSVVKAYEDLGSHGTEMTQRRIIESRLRTLAHGCSEARRVLLEQAIGVVPANNAELRTLRRTIRDLTRRIKQRQDQHDRALAEHMAKQRANEYQADLAAAKQALEVATSRWKQANARFLAVDEAMTKDQELAAELRKRRQDIADRTQRSGALESRIDRIDAEMVRVRAKHTVSTAGAASYRPVAAGRAALFDPQRLRVAGVLTFSACCCALLLIGAVWFGVRLPGRVRRPESA
ncbi:MAG: FHA domain-containing protein [Phycisphaerae bacterium]